jgi:uncharacterized membrane protein YkoI
MTRARKLLIAGAAVVAVSAGGVGIAQAVGGDSEEQVSGPEADRAKRAAVQAVGGGHAVGVEREDDGKGAWEVEVERDDGSTLEVRLDGAYRVIGAERDDEDADRDDD